ncbi:MAG: hypothetical protein WBM02_05420 [bacterium]
MINRFLSLDRACHASSRLRIGFDILIGVVCLCIILIGVRLVSLRTDGIRLQNRLARFSVGQSEIIAKQALDRYQLPIDTDALDVLNDKLAETGLLRAVMDLTPGNPIRSNGVIGWPIRLRLSPVPGNRLVSLLNTIEDNAPRFMIASLQMTRIRSHDTHIDITMNLMMFQPEIKSGP